jgi:hypothetical protein
MKKMSFVIAILVSAALAGCHHKKAANNGGSGDMGSGSGSAMGSAAGSGDMGSGAAGSGGGSGGM